MWSGEWVIFRANTSHSLGIIFVSFGARQTRVSCEIVILWVGAYCTKLSIEVRILTRTILANSRNNIIDLLEWTIAASWIRIIPIFRMVTLNTFMTIPELVVCHVTDTFLSCIIIYSPLCTVMTRSISLVFPTRAERTNFTPIDDILQWWILAFAFILFIKINLILSAFDFHTGSSCDIESST